MIVQIKTEKRYYVEMTSEQKDEIISALTYVLELVNTGKTDLMKRGDALDDLRVSLLNAG